MATESTNYVTGSNVTLTLGCASLANGAYRESTEVDNASVKAVDGQLVGKVTSGTTPTAGSVIIIYLAGHDGTTRPGNLTGSDSTITPAGEQTQFEIGRVIAVDGTSNHTYEFFIGSIAALFGGVMPQKFSVIVYNGTGQALNATGGNHAFTYTPVKFDIA